MSRFSTRECVCIGQRFHRAQHRDAVSWVGAPRECAPRVASTAERKFSWGPEIGGDGVHFRVYAPKRKRVTLVLEGGREIALDRDRHGWFSASVRDLREGARYRYRLDDEAGLFKDPASRFQPQGPEGPSEAVDGRAFSWTDASWRGTDLRGRVLYEMHIGTFTKEGTFAAATRELPALAELGIGIIELMPLADFPGKFGWGYDGVDLYAPSRLYGRPDDLRAFIDRAHALGLAVIHDVVYNHVGPSGCGWRAFTDAFFATRYENEWGDPLDFETDDHVRAYFTDNAAYWIDEFHFDGLRLDATQSIFDASERHVIEELTARAREAAGDRRIVVVAENEPQRARLARPAHTGGLGLDAIWNDDFHHAARVAATGRREAYYSSTYGRAQELVSAVKWGTLFQGQFYPWQRGRRGSPALDLAPPSFVLYLQNHDQVANSAGGRRLSELTTAGRLRALTALLLLAPGTPMLFQGQEFAASAPFLFFADHEPKLAELVAKGRQSFLAQFPSLRDPSAASLTARPDDPKTFEACKLDFRERESHAPVYRLHRDLLTLRRTDPVFSAQRADWLHGAVLSPEAFVLRYATATGTDRLVLINLGPDLDLAHVAEPLLAPIDGHDWANLFSTEDPLYGGLGTPPPGEHGERVLSAHAALVLAPRALTTPRAETVGAP